MSWSTSNDYCGTCRSWKGKRQIKKVSDRVIAEFPQSDVRGRCSEKGDERPANMGPCSDYRSCL